MSAVGMVTEWRKLPVMDKGLVFGLLAGLSAAIMAGCASGPPTADAEPFLESAALRYERLRFEVLGPVGTEADVGVESGGEGAKEGLQMFAVSPVACMGAGMFYGLCLAVSPALPFVAAARAQDPELSLAQLEAVAEKILAFGVEDAARTQLAEHLRGSEIPVDDDPARIEAAHTLRLTLGPIELEHSGYKGGRVTVALNYEVTLVDADGVVVRRKRDKRNVHLDSDASSYEIESGVNYGLRNWISLDLVAAIDDTLINWSPPIELGAVRPSLVSKRSLIGIGYKEWPFVTSLQPAMQWQSVAEAAGEEFAGSIEDLSYDLELYLLVTGPENSYAERRLVYRRQGLAEPAHMVEEPLRPCTRYLWRPRARFRHQGVAFATGLEVQQLYVLQTPGDDCKYAAWAVSPYELAREAGAEPL